MQTPLWKVSNNNCFSILKYEHPCANLPLQWVLVSLVGMLLKGKVRIEVTATIFPSNKLLHNNQTQEWETGRSTGQRSSYEEQMMGANAVSK